jgi:hypothetical protein
MEGSDTFASNSFDISEAISGTTVAVGAGHHAAGAGRAYVFTKTESGWKQLAELKGSDTVSLPHQESVFASFVCSGHPAA